MRPSPKVKRPPGGRGEPCRVERHPMAPASVSMCAASESRGQRVGEDAGHDLTTMKVAMMPSATASQRRSASAAGPGDVRGRARARAPRLQRTPGSASRRPPRAMPAAGPSAGTCRS
jgi:hypothetical protein